MKKRWVFFTIKLQEHKQEAQDELEYYRMLANDLTIQENTKLKDLKSKFSAFISADYMMGKKLTILGCISSTLKNILCDETSV